MIHVRSDGESDLLDIAHYLRKAERVLIVAGAGISTAAGIPDFRSKGGLYAKGAFFHVSTISDPETLKLALKSYRLIRGKKPTSVHDYILGLNNRGRLLRCYTSNFDGLEREGGLEYDLEGGRVVQLHGSVRHLRCNKCCETYAWEEETEKAAAEGLKIPCRKCRSIPPRAGRARRECTIGRLRTHVVGLGESWRDTDIAEHMNRDQQAGPDLLLVLGTSLTADGPRDMVNGFCSAVRNNGGKVIYVNLQRPRKSKWRSLPDYWVEWDLDRWVRTLMCIESSLALRMERVARDCSYQ